MSFVKRLQRLAMPALLIVSFVAAPLAALSQETPSPDMVNIPGTLQPLLGCSGEWQPDCEATLLEFDEAAGLWHRTFDLPAGSYEYKVALNGSWTENYGGKADRDGPNIVLEVPEDMPVTFIYDHDTHWIVDSVRQPIITAPGTFQDELGCAEDWSPDCLVTYMQDPDGDGVYIFETYDIPVGDWETQAAGGAAILFTVPEAGSGVQFAFDTTTQLMSVVVVAPGARFEPAGDLSQARARWVCLDTIAWDVAYEEGYTYELNMSQRGGMRPGFTSMERADGAIALTVDKAGFSEATLAKFPHVAGQLALRLSEDALDLAPTILKGQIAVSAYDAKGNLIDATSVQIPGVIDDLYAYDGPLGVHFDADGAPTLYLWAPTARSVTLHLFDGPSYDAQATLYDMTPGDKGVWSITGTADWLYKYYLYEVEVYAPYTGQVERNLVTDPYSMSLSANSTRSQIVNLDDPALMPEGWLEMQKPPLEAFEDIVLYELHLRDFSAHDMSVPEEYRGTYMAFTVDGSNGMRHLEALADAGLTHLHLLPTFDIATINENRDKRARFEPDFDELAQYPPDSPEQQMIIDEVRDLDGFNWGYDPYHFNTPEGSYSTDPNGAPRILEYRAMVQALGKAGLRVVTDVVYNHTNASGQADKSVFDRIVPGYYHRLDDVGNVTNSTCCANTATEHAMMRRFMVDSVVFWATQYKIDGFRFDLMGHHMLGDMQAARAALDALTPEKDGVDGKLIYVYGEGWDFGEVANNARGVNASQLNLGGSGIGSFNDRLRDSVRGGNPFGDEPQQGFATGLYTDSNGVTSGTEEEQRARLFLFADRIRVGLAGNLRDYPLVNYAGQAVTGADIDYNGAPTGYTLDPQEHIVYVSAHDNETLWDIIQYKAPADASLAERMRMDMLALDIVALSQGVPFFHAGSDMLRSKSMDRNSYNSGDWFNHLDFSYETHNWGSGLPPQGDNGHLWDLMRPLLARDDIKPGKDEITKAVLHVQQMLMIRKSSPLFRLRTAEDVMARVAFHNMGPDQLPGVIVMSISDMQGADLDPYNELIVVVFNASPDTVTFTGAAFAGLGLRLHPLQATYTEDIASTSSFDAAAGTFTVPGLTTAVFVLSE
ncbi:MAG: pullulanase-type alpha-1,6-glucosidase [Anaerolineae bacterium]|nr:pullulanase-type alpha-1,6-glucosidase [Anaerolineae bacterium]